MEKIVVAIILYDSCFSINSRFCRDMHQIDNEPILFKMVRQILNLNPEKIYIITENNKLVAKINCYIDRYYDQSFIFIKPYFTTVPDKINLIIYGVFPYILTNFFSDMICYHKKMVTYVTVASFNTEQDKLIDCGIYVSSGINVDDTVAKSYYIVPSEHKIQLYSLKIKNEKIFINLSTRCKNKHINYFINN